MEIRVLKYFLTVAREGSITRAAEILHVTQPTLSRQILELERETGVKLLDRGSRHVSLTSDGLLLKRRAEEIVDLVDKTEKELSGNKTVEGTVNCAGGELLVMDHFSDLIMRFQEKHPLVRFDINTDITGRVNEKMDSGLIDTAIFVRPFDAEKYDYVPIGPEARFCAAMRTDDPLAQKEHVTREDLAGKKLVLISRGELNADIRSWLGDVCETIQTPIHCDLGANFSLFAKRKGLYIITTEGTMPLVDDRIVKYVPLYPEMRIQTVVAWKRGQPFGRAAQAFIEFLKEELGEK